MKASPHTSAAPSLTGVGDRQFRTFSILFCLMFGLVSAGVASLSTDQTVNYNGTLVVGGATNGAITSNEAQWWTFNVVQNTPVTITATRTSGNLGPNLRAYQGTVPEGSSPAPMPILASRSNGSNATLSISFTPTFTGPATLQVARFFDETGGYAVTAQGIVQGASTVLANAGPNQSVNEGEMVTLDGTQSSGNSLSFSWTQIDGTPLVALTGANSAQPTFTAPLVAIGGVTLTFRLTVSDGSASNSGTVNVRVNNVNHEPIADAGPDESVPELSVVTLDGSNSGDSDGDVLGYSWTQTAGPTVDLIEPFTASPTFTAPNINVDRVALTFRLTVQDGYGGSQSDDVTITVMYVNRPPTANAGPAQTQAEGTVVTLAGSATDPDGNALSLSWTQISGPAVELSDATAAAPTFVAPLVTRFGAVLNFALQATDSFGATSGTPSTSVTVTNINHPPLADAGETQSVVENAIVTLAATALDADEEEASLLVCTWKQTAGPSVGELGNGAQVSFTAPMVTAAGDPEAKVSLKFQVTVVDPNGASATDEVEVVVANIDHSPIANAGGIVIVDEGGDVMLDGSLSSDPDGDALACKWVQIAGPSVVLNGSNTATPSFKAPAVNAGDATLKFQLTVDDGYGGTSSDVATVSVRNVNDLPEVTNARPSIATLWPPDHRLVTVQILGVTDTENNVTIRVTGVTQDEPTNGAADGNTPIDAVINDDGTLLLRAERSGLGDGRIYRVSFTASDPEGSVRGVVIVTVPHHKNGKAVRDKGGVFDSTRP
jgi:hypothetical protein